MYGKLILRSARRSVQDYLIYLVTLTLCVGLFYAFLSISSRYYHPALGAEFDLSYYNKFGQESRTASQDFPTSRA